MKPTIAIIGDYNSTAETHLALNKSLDYLKEGYGFEYQWLETNIVAKERDRVLNNCAGIWSAPGSPVKSLNGALYAITFTLLNNGCPP